MTETNRRYAPGRAFPPYAFLPGTDPHPSRDPRGHSFGAAEPKEIWRPASEWRDNEPYLAGVDLYNHAYLWEAHEAWEGLWHPSKVDPPQAEHIQGLIQCAAACLKVAMGQPGGLARLTELGTGRLERVARQEGARFMGLDVFAFVVEMRAFAASEPSDVSGRPVLELDIAGVEPPSGTRMLRPH